ncbi:MAG: carbon-phosphorus lyase complex subunit PhnI [Pseudomonadota bacterium]
MYVAVKGGERAIANAHRWLDEVRRGDTDVPEIGVDQIEQQLGLAVDRVMCEGSIHDRRLAALAIKQARGDLIEAIFLLRAYRATLPRFGYTQPIDTGQMAIRRRISATYKDLPGGQVLGPTYDYTHRLLDFSLDTQGAEEETPARSQVERDNGESAADTPRVTDLLGTDSLIEPSSAMNSPNGNGRVSDLAREPLDYPAGRDLRLQRLARGDEGFLLAIGYSTQRGYARTHPFAGEIRHGAVGIEIVPPELGFPVEIGAISVTECQMITQFTGSSKQPPQFTRGYGLTFGHCERKAMSMSMVDRALRADEFGEQRTAPAQDEEFVLAHCDNIQASGFVEHLKLPHYVDFQAELDLVRRMRKVAAALPEAPIEAPTEKKAKTSEAADV